MLRNMSLLVLAVMLGQQPASPEPSWPTGRLPEPELLAGVAPCRCVDIRQCPAVLEILRSVTAARGPASVELNRLKRSTCGFQGFVPFVCCPGQISMDMRIHAIPNTIGHGIPSTLHNPDYLNVDYHEHRSFVPVYQPYPNSDSNSKTDSHLRDHSEPFLFHDRRSPVFHDADSSYEREEEESESEDSEEDHVSTEESAEELPITHFSNHPPHVHEHSHHFPDSSKESKEYSVEETKSEHLPVTSPSPARCRPGTTKTPVDVSVFSRGGVAQLGQLEQPCGKQDRTQDVTDSPQNNTKILLELQGAASSPGIRLLPGDQCGVTVDERIVGGKEAELGAFPWIARIGYIRNSSNPGGPFLYRCGGSLLNERYVLTAAHCVTNLPGGLELATIRLGEHDERSDPDCKTPTQVTCADPVQDFRPEVVIVHPQYDSPKYSSDIALIRLNRPARITTYVSPICLPLEEQLALKNYTGLKATVAGWGATHLGLTSSSPVLQWVRLGVVDASRCAEAYERAEVQVDGWRQLCAGGERMADSCDGDSGGPLISPEQPSPDSLPRYFLVGVVSFGAKICGTENMPGVYTRVAAYLRWILDELRP